MKNRAVIGIQISEDQVRGACVRQTGSGIQLMGLRSVSTPAGGVDSEGQLDPQILGDAVRRVCNELDPRATHVVAGLTGCSLVARVMEIPPVPDGEIRSVLRGEMDHYRILPAGQSAFDFYKLPDGAEAPTPGQPGEDPVNRVLLMGAEERLVASYRATVDASGMNLSAVEPGSIALLRALYPQLRSAVAVATVVISATGTDVFITHEGLLQFYRRIDTGIPDLRNAVNLAEAAAEPNRARGGLLVSFSDDEGDEQQPERAPAVDTYNRQSISLLMTEVQRSIDYYIREFPSAGEAMVVRFAIDAADAPDLFDVVKQHLRTTAEMASVVDSVACDSDLAERLRGGDAFRYAVAVGLALRGFASEYAESPALDLVATDRVVVERRMAPRAMLLSAAAASFILLGTLAAALLVGNSISHANRTLKQTRTEADALRAKHAARVAQLDRQKNLTEAIQKRSKPLRRAVDFVSASVGRQASLQTLDFDDSGSIDLTGNARSPRVVADLMDTLNLAGSLAPVRLKNLMRLQSPTASGMEFELQTNFVTPVEQAAVAPGQSAGASSGPAQGGS